MKFSRGADENEGDRPASRKAKSSPLPNMGSQRRSGYQKVPSPTNQVGRLPLEPISKAAPPADMPQHPFDLLGGQEQVESEKDTLVESFMLRQYWNNLVRHSYLILLTFMMGIGGSLLIYYILPVKYKATSSIAIQSGGGGAGPANPLQALMGGGGGGGASQSLTSPGYLQLILRSRDFKKKLLTHFLEQSELLKGKVTLSTDELNMLLSSKLVQWLKMVSIDKDEQSMVNIQSTLSSSPHLVVVLNNSITQLLMEHMNESAHVQKTHLFDSLNQLMQEETDKFTSTTMAMAQLIKDHPVSLGENHLFNNKQSMQQKLVRNESKSLELAYLEKKIKTRLGDLEKKFGIVGVDPKDIFWAHLTDPSERKLKELKVKKLELEARYQKGSTLMTKVDNEIDSFEAIIRPLEMRGMKIVEVDSVSNQFAFEYSKLRSELIPLQDNQKTLTQQMRELKAQFSNAPPELIELKKLESQKAFSETILKELGQQKERQKIVQATAKEPAKVFAYAVSSERASKSMLFFLAAGIVASFAFSLVAIVALQQWDNTIHSSIDFRRHFKLPILGVHPVWEKDKKVTDMYDSTKQEAYETLKTHIAHSPFKHVEKCLLVVSALQREGKTFTSKHLAQSYAREGKNVILVMGDLRKTADLDDLKIKGDIGCGLSDYLEGKADLRQVVYASELSPSMFVIPNGDRISHPSTLLKKDEMDKLISFLKKKFDVVIIDSPAVLPVSDYSHYMKFAHGVIVILRAAFTPLGSEKHAIQKLEQVKAPIIGVLLNQALKRDMTVDYYYGSNYSGYYDEK